MAFSEENYFALYHELVKRVRWIYWILNYLRIRWRQIR